MRFFDSLMKLGTVESIRTVIFKLNFLLRLGTMAHKLYPNQVLTRYNNADIFLAVSRRLLTSIEACIQVGNLNLTDQRKDLGSLKDEISKIEMIPAIREKIKDNPIRKPK